ncbi:MAG: DNA-directed RNA polymerase subunit omega [Verrucomicrobia bacterium]|jgi:DNA-directed RNA polymerase subunit K/omega|nr:DNA-directed RNA polymerase subunit omega [Cytophagales bacterium]
MSEKKLSKITSPVSIVTRNAEHIARPTANIYQSVSIISKRARQISTRMKEELNNKLTEFASTVDNLEEVFENREQIEISKFYERMPKPASLATDEFLENKIQYHFADDETE